VLSLYPRNSLQTNLCNFMQILLFSIVLLVQICTILHKVFYGYNESTLDDLRVNLISWTKTSQSLSLSRDGPFASAKETVFDETFLFCFKRLNSVINKDKSLFLQMESNSQVDYLMKRNHDWSLDSFSNFDEWLIIAIWIYNLSFIWHSSTVPGNTTGLIMVMMMIMMMMMTMMTMMMMITMIMIVLVMMTIRHCYDSNNGNLRSNQPNRCNIPLYSWTKLNLKWNHVKPTIKHSDIKIQKFSSYTHCQR